MNADKFIDAIKIAVEESTVEGIASNLLAPPGRNPSKELVEMSNWFRSLSKDDKTMAIKIIRDAVQSSIFSFLCVLDGVSSIEGYGEKGELELYYKKGNEKVLLNDPNKEFLHDIFNAE